MLFTQLQQAIRSRNYQLYITHIQSHTGLPGPMVQDNKEVNQLLIGDVFKASKFHEKHHVNEKGLKKKIFHYLATNQRNNNNKKMSYLFPIQPDSITC